MADAGTCSNGRKPTRTRAIPVIVTSTDQRLLERAQAGAERYGQRHVIARPLDLDELLAAIHDLIGGA